MVTEPDLKGFYEKFNGFVSFTFKRFKFECD